MGSTFFGLNTALSGLTAQQRALNTVSHNLTNANTVGYSRQRVTMTAAPAFAQPALNTAVGAGQIGTGVEVAAFARLRDQFIDVQFRGQNASLGQWNARGDALGRVSQVIDEPGSTGLSSLLQRFWAGWQSVSLNPESASAREALRSTAQDLTSGFQGLQGQLASAQGDANALIANQVDRVNSLAGQVNQLNQAIAKVVAVGQQPNDLMDRRDALIDELSGFAQIAVTQPSATNGKLSIAIGSQLLVDSTADAVNVLAIDSAGAATVGGTATTLADGSLRGLVDVRDSVIGGTNGYLAQLDALAGALSTSVNAVHAAGFGLDGSTGNAFFSGTTAATLGLSAAVTGSLDKIAGSDTAGNVPGGSATAVAIAQLQRQTQVIGASTTTIDGFHQALVARVGVQADQAFRMAEVQQGVADATANRRDAVSGVSIDEEISDMVRFQKSYNAAARMVTTLDEMLETIVTRMGIVGR